MTGKLNRHHAVPRCLPASVSPRVASPPRTRRFARPSRGCCRLQAARRPRHQALAAFQPRGGDAHAPPSASAMSPHLGKVVGTIFETAQQTSSGVGGSTVIKWFERDDVAGFLSSSPSRRAQGRGIGMVHGNRPRRAQREAGASEIGLSTARARHVARRDVPASRLPRIVERALEVRPTTSAITEQARGRECSISVPQNSSLLPLLAHLKNTSRSGGQCRPAGYSGGHARPRLAYSACEISCSVPFHFGTRFSPLRHSVAARLSW